MNPLLVRILITAQDTASAVFRALGGAGLAAMNPLTLAAAAVGGGLLAVGVGTVRAATGFDQAMHKVAALSDMFQQTGYTMQWYQDQLLALAPQIDVAPTQLAKALYFVASAGFRGQQAIDVLRYSAMAAAASMGDMSKVADMVTSALNAYAGEGYTVGQVTDIMMQALVQGKMEMQALETSFSFVAVTGRAAGFSLQEMAAAVATLTRVSGESGARRVQMDLDNLIRRLGDVGGVAQTAKKLHIAFNETAFASSNFIDRLKILMQMSGFSAKTLQDLRDAAHGNEQVFEKMALKLALNNTTFKQLAGGAAAFLPAAILLTGNGKTFNDILAKMTGNGNQTADAFAKMRESTGQQWNMFETTLQSISILIGLHLLPFVNQLLGAFIRLGRGLITWLQNKQHVDELKTAIEGIGAVVMMFLLPAIITATGAAIAFAAPILIIIGLGIILGPVVRKLIDHFGGWHKILKDVGDKLKDGKDKLSDFKTWLDKNKDTIKDVAGVITGFFIPSLVKSGVEAVAAAGKIVGKFIVSLIRAGLEGFIAAGKIALFIAKIILAGIEAAATGAKLIASFVAAVIKAGVEAVATGVVIIARFVAALLVAGAQAVAQGAIIIANFVKAMIQSGVEAALASDNIYTAYGGALIAAGAQAVANGAKITASFVASMVKSGVEAVANGAKITASFVASLIATGAQAVANGAKVAASFVASLIATGAQAVINAAKVTASFIAMLIRTAVQAVITGGALLLSLIPAIVSLGIQALATAVGGGAALITWLITYIPIALSAAAATIAATWPFLLIGAAILGVIALIILLVTHWNQVTTKLGEFKDGLAKDFGAAWQALGNTVGGVWNGITSTIKDAINTVIGWINDVITKWNSIKINVPSVTVAGHTIGGGTIGAPQIPTIPLLASGGRVLRAGLAVVGERGAEVVNLPAGSDVYGNSASNRMLSSGALSGSGGGTCTINASFPNVRYAKEIQDAFQGMRETEYRRARRAGHFEGTRAGI